MRAVVVVIVDQLRGFEHEVFEVFEPPLLQAIELLIISAMRALYEAVILRLPFPGMEMGEERGSLQLELMELLVISPHTSGLMASVFRSPICLSLQDPGRRGRWSSQIRLPVRRQRRFRLSQQADSILFEAKLEPELI